MSFAPLLILGGADVLLLGGKKKKSSSSCPSVISASKDDIPSVIVTIPHGGGVTEVALPKIAYDEAKSGNRNIVDMTKKTIAHMIPLSCIADASILVNVDVGMGEVMKLSPPVLFYGVGFTIAEDLFQAEVISKSEAMQLVAMLDKWWVDHMGSTPIPNS
jgi:hypothetical protein